VQHSVFAVHAAPEAPQLPAEGEQTFDVGSQTLLQQSLFWAHVPLTGAHVHAPPSPPPSASSPASVGGAGGLSSLPQPMAVK
jgi:hypothetical protein